MIVSGDVAPARARRGRPVGPREPCAAPWSPRRAQGPRVALEPPGQPRGRLEWPHHYYGSMLTHSHSDGEFPIYSQGNILILLPSGSVFNSIHVTSIHTHTFNSPSVNCSFYVPISWYLPNTRSSLINVSTFQYVHSFVLTLHRRL